MQYTLLKKPVLPDKRNISHTKKARRLTWQYQGSQPMGKPAANRGTETDRGSGRDHNTAVHDAASSLCNTARTPYQTVVQNPVCSRQGTGSNHQTHNRLSELPDHQTRILQTSREPP